MGVSAKNGEQAIFIDGFLNEKIAPASQYIISRGKDQFR